MLSIALSAALAPAAEDAVIELQDGRVVQGQIDEATDETRLWLRREAAGVQVTSGFAWGQIRLVQSGQQSYRGCDFQAVAQSTKTPGKLYRELDVAIEGGPKQSPALLPAAHQSSANVGERLRLSAAERRVKTLYIEAYLAQWDGDPQADGLRVFVYPLAADGELVPVNGQIDLYLLGEVERASGVVASPQMPQFRELERQSATVRSGDFKRGAAVIELPFRQFHPDVYFDVARQAVVHARLGVPGQGLFLASDANVQLRGFSRIRDELQMQTRQRFFPTENAVER
jgi:hypothetical protein